MQEILQQNPTASPDEVTAFFDTLMATRQMAYDNSAPLMLATISEEGLTLAETTELSHSGGLEIYQWIMAHADLNSGLVQDAFKIKYPSVKITAVMPMTTIIEQMNIKWYLYKHIVVHRADTLLGAREGLREILVMLMEGPPGVATEASLKLTQIEFEPLVMPGGADAWIAARGKNYERYAPQLAKLAGQHQPASDPNSAALMAMTAAKEKEVAAQRAAVAAARASQDGQNECEVGCNVHGCKGNKNKEKDCILNTDHPVGEGTKWFTLGGAEYIRQARIAKKANPALNMKAEFKYKWKGRGNGKGGGKGGGGGGKGAGRGGLNMMTPVGFTLAGGDNDAIEFAELQSNDPRDADDAGLLSAMQRSATNGALFMLAPAVGWCDVRRGGYGESPVPI